MSIRRARLSFEGQWAHIHQDDIPTVLAALRLYAAKQAFEEDAQRIYDMADALASAVDQ